MPGHPIIRNVWFSFVWFIHVLCFSSGPANADPHYERVFLLDPQYQNPAVLRNKLPELSQSAEASGERTRLPLNFHRHDRQKCQRIKPGLTKTRIPPSKTPHLLTQACHYVHVLLTICGSLVFVHCELPHLWKHKLVWKLFWISDALKMFQMHPCRHAWTRPSALVLFFFFLFSEAVKEQRPLVKQTAAVCPLLAQSETPHISNRKNSSPLSLVNTSWVRFLYFLQNMSNKLTPLFSLSLLLYFLMML